MYLGNIRTVLSETGKQLQLQQMETDRELYFQWSNKWVAAPNDDYCVRLHNSVPSLPIEYKRKV